MKTLLLVFALLAVSSIAGRGATDVRPDDRGVTLAGDTQTTRIEVWSDRIVRVIHRPTATSAPLGASLAVIAKPQNPVWKLTDAGERVSLETSALRVQLDKATGAVRFLDATGHLVLAETPNGSSFTPTTVGPSTTLRVRQTFALDPAEGIYGLGQHPDGFLNHRGTSVHLQQENRIVGVPMLVSSHGYGVLWDNPAVTDVDAGKSDPSTLTWTSEAGEAADYYFILGPELDAVVAGYRELTGAVPMFPQWAWGFWQCRERYQKQAELLGVVAEYRRRGIPLDGIIQDWQYWKPGEWGTHDFDPARYPDPTAMVEAVHRANAHIIISIWPRFDLGLAHTAELEKAGALYPPTYPNVYPKGQGKWYDPFHPDGRRLYWKFLAEKLFTRGFDGWWMDASEAELGGKWGEMRELTTAAGPGAKVFNAFPLMHSTGVYQGQRAATPAKRVVILTRSAYAGQQRNSAITWSGDTHGTWEVFGQQVPAGLNFSITGIPYWNTDIGGFFAGDPADPKYAELFTRWFQFGAFCPMFRVHGTGKPKEIWRFDEATQKILIDYDRLRYHLLPYIYSVAWRVTNEGYTMLRPLVMDFRTDARVRDIPDQFLLGPALMANPVMKAGAITRRVYLPGDTRWTDFWTGESHAGGQSIETAASLATMPLFVRAGSIVPYGPDVQYAAEQPAAPLELRVYRGADGDFTLYEDEGDNYNYEKGAHATIPLRWDEKAQTLTIGGRRGEFSGLVRERTFRVVWVSTGHGSGLASTEKADVEVRYTGQAVTVGFAQTSPAAAAPFPVTISVDAGKPLGELKPIWRFFGADEPNYATMRDGKKLLAELGELRPKEVYFRAHNLLCTGDGTPALKWGSTNIYTEDAQGRPVYDWTIIDRIFDTYLARGVRPYAQIGFMPQALSTHPEPYQHDWRPGASYNKIGTGWAYPPKDYAKWAELVYQWVKHCVDRYGRAEVEQWYWEVWNEANISPYWHGSPEEFYKLHDYAIDAVRRALPTARVGGPDSAGAGGKFTENFLQHVVHGKNYATGQTGTPTDFLSFHAKGSPGFVGGHVRLGIAAQLKTIDTGFAMIAAVPELKAKPIVIGESDPDGCAACQGPQLGYRNTTMYSSYTAAVFARKHVLADRRGVNLAGALTWAFEFEDQPFFAGQRTLANNGIDLPVMNVFRMFSKMGGQRLATTSTGEVPLDAIMRDGVRGDPDVASLSSLDGKRLCVLVWHYHDEDVPGPDAAVELALEHLPLAAGNARLTHYRIDTTHSNAFTVWQNMGAPTAPNDAQYAQLVAAGQLATLGEPTVVPIANGAATLKFALPRQAVSLLVLEW